jgi:hypothetical protein
MFRRSQRPFPAGATLLQASQSLLTSRKRFPATLTKLRRLYLRHTRYASDRRLVAKYDMLDEELERVGFATCEGVGCESCGLSNGQD